MSTSLSLLLFSASLQEDNLDLVLGIKHTLKTIKSLKALAGQDPFQWPTAKLVCNRIKDEDGSKQYQGYNTTTLDYCKEQALTDLKQLDLKMRDWLEWSDVKLLCNILLFIDTQGWQVKSSSTNTSMSDSDDNLDGIKSAMESITSLSELSLRLKGLTCCPFGMKLKKLLTTQEGTSPLTSCATGKFGISYIPHQILADGQMFSKSVSFYSAYYFPVDELRESSQH